LIKDATVKYLNSPGMKLLQLGLR